MDQTLLSPDGKFHRRLWEYIAVPSDTSIKKEYEKIEKYQDPKEREDMESKSQSGHDGDRSTQGYDF